MKTKSKISIKKLKSDYSRFNKIDGSHEFKDWAKESFVDYEARYRKGGKVTAFNFDLAKDMGLIPSDHPCEMNRELEKSILDTFSIVIINEYDKIHNIKFDKNTIKKNKYMATRYLQLQHPCKIGTTSGDGRSIWNGQISNKGKTWDLSSCGTGATKLSPATNIKNKFFKTGDPSISYGCGYSEVDEGLAALFFSEVMRKNSIPTEKVLGIIEFSGGLSINIRAHENLIRPSHMFNHLKQGNVEELRSVVDYYIYRQEKNKEWTDIPSGKKKYDYFLNKQCEVFAKMAAKFEDEYIFCWLDWDGDNILMDGSIIDYGSVRQFGLFHHEYRYDDVERYSTTITEQKNKSKYILQTFIQMVEYLKTGKKKSLKLYNKDKCLKKFDELFIDEKRRNILYKIGLGSTQIDFLIDNKKKLIDSFLSSFSYFERSKSKVGVQKVADGINWSAIYCMRDILRELPQLLLVREENIEDEEFLTIMRSNYIAQEDLEISSYTKKKVSDFQRDYKKILKEVEKKTSKNLKQLLLEITMRSSVINRYDRVTGDAITTVISRVMKSRPKLNPDQLYKILADFIEYQDLNPRSTKKKEIKTKNTKVLKDMFKIVREYREGL